MRMAKNKPNYNKREIPVSSIQSTPYFVIFLDGFFILFVCDVVNSQQAQGPDHLVFFLCLRQVEGLSSPSAKTHNTEREVFIS